MHRLGNLKRDLCLLRSDLWGDGNQFEERGERERSKRASALVLKQLNLNPDDHHDNDPGHGECDQMAQLGEATTEKMSDCILLTFVKQ